MNRDQGSFQSLRPHGAAAEGEPRRRRSAFSGSEIVEQASPHRPRGVGEMLDVAIDLLRERFATYVGVCVLLWAPVRMLQPLGSAANGSKFFATGVEDLKIVPEAALSTVFQICTRQLVLSSSTALDTFRLIPTVAAEIGDDDLLIAVLDLAADIAQRSAKHSAEFVAHTPAVARALAVFEDQKREVADSLLVLANQFANRTGGMTADLWASMPAVLEKLDPVSARDLIQRAAEFLDFGGSVTLHFVSGGSTVIIASRVAFDDWVILARTIARHGNAVLISFLRATPKFFSALAGNRSVGQ